MFNIRLRKMRMFRSITQQRFADKLGVALRTYQCYEQGSRFPSLDLLIKIADILDISLDYLFGRDDWLKAHEVFFDEFEIDPPDNPK